MAEETTQVGIMQLALRLHDNDTNRGSEPHHPLTAPKGWKRVWARMTYDYNNDDRHYTLRRGDYRGALQNGFNIVVNSLCKDCYDRGHAAAICIPFYDHSGADTSDQKFAVKNAFYFQKAVAASSIQCTDPPATGDFSL